MRTIRPRLRVLKFVGKELAGGVHADVCAPRTAAVGSAAMPHPFASQDEFEDRKFDGLDLRDGVVEGVAFHHCTFTACTFTGTRWLRCRFVDCTFVRCDLSNIKPLGTLLRDTSFTETKLLGVDWTAAAEFGRPVFQTCVLDYGSFAGRDMRRAKLKECVARETDFSDANLTEAVFDGTDLNGARFRHTNLSRADLRKASNYAISPVDNTLKQARFSLPEAIGLLHGLGILLDD